MYGEVELVLYSALRDAVGSKTFKAPCGYTLRRALEDLTSRSRAAARLLEEVGWSVYGLRDDGSRLDLDSELPCGGRVHVVLPPSGGALVRARLLRGGEQLDLNSLIAEAASASRGAGAVAVFVGVVKGVVEGGVVVERLVYEDAGGLTERVMERIASEVASKHGLDAAMVYHYTGVRRPGEITIVAVVAGRSRLNVYPALQELVDRVKKEAPIWKAEHREGGEIVYILGDRIVSRRVIGEGRPLEAEGLGHEL